jgi:protein-S-isoprenylcysteine O-methyltransferase Ste14
MLRRIYFLFGIVAHFMFLVVFAYMAGFVGNFLVPKSIDSPVEAGGSVPLAATINLVLLAAFAVPHSVMARPAFKRWWTQYVPQPLERTVYVFTSNILMIALLAFWRPIDFVIYDLGSPVARAAMWALFATGWLLVPLASLMINHFDLFGTRQVWLHMRNTAYSYLPFRTPLLYKVVRHPLYVGWITAFWATPTLTAGHALFAAVLTIYILAAIPLEERDLVAIFGDRYIQYRRKVGGLIPRWPRRAATGRPGVPIDDEKAGVTGIAS